MCDQFSFSKMTIFINIAPIENCKFRAGGWAGGWAGKNYARKICVAAIQKLRCTSSRPAASPAPGFRRSPLLPTPLLPTPSRRPRCCSLLAACTYAKRVLIPQDNNLLGRKWHPRKFRAGNSKSIRARKINPEIQGWTFKVHSDKEK